MDTLTKVYISTSILKSGEEDDEEWAFQIVVGETAQKHVLRTFNPSGEQKVDATKVLCAALIQQMIDIKTHAAEYGHTDDGDLYAKAVAQVRAAERAIELVELAQMQLVKANFVQA